MSSDTSQIAILGSSSRLTYNWMQFADTRPLVISSRTSNRNDDLNLPSIDTAGDLSDLERILQEHGTSILVNNIAVTNVETCESDPQLALQVHALLPEAIAGMCRRLGVKFVHISTDHVSSGKTRFLSERDATTPLNQYGITKLEGEKRVLRANPEALVVRTNFFGLASAHRKTFSSWIIGELHEGRHVNIFADVFFTPIYARTLIETIDELLANKATGLFSIASPERISKFDFAQLLSKIFGLDAHLIRPSRLKDRKDLCRRPHEMGLNTTKVTETIGHDIPSISTQVFEYKHATESSKI